MWNIQHEYVFIKTRHLPQVCVADVFAITLHICDMSEHLKQVMGCETQSVRSVHPARSLMRSRPLLPVSLTPAVQTGEWPYRERSGTTTSACPVMNKRPKVHFLFCFEKMFLKQF